MSIRDNQTRNALFFTLAVLVLGAALFFVFQKREASHADQQKSVSVPISQQQQEKTAQGERAIVHNNRGVTEVSLPDAPNVVIHPTIQQLKDFQKHSAELQKEADKNTEKKVVHIRDAALEVTPLYTFDEQKKE